MGRIAWNLVREANAGKAAWIWIGLVLLDVEILLNRSAGVRKEGPLGSD